MPCVGKETAGIGKHADKLPDDAEIGKTRELIEHAGLVVIEPPGGAVLDLACAAFILETADDGIDGSIVNRIQGIINYIK